MKTKSVILLTVLLVLCIIFIGSYTRYNSGTVEQQVKPHTHTDWPGQATTTYMYTNDVKLLDGHATVPRTSRNISFNPSVRDSLVFIHIPKTGGSEFIRHLVTLKLENKSLCSKFDPTISTKRKRERAFCPTHAAIGQQYDIDDRRPWLISEKTLGWFCGLHPFYSEYKSCISSEAKLSETKQKFDPNAKFHYCTMLRHPVLRYISEYLHFQRGATFSYRHVCDGRAVQETEMPPCYPGFYEHKAWMNVTLSKFLLCDSNWANNRQTFSVADLETVHCYNKTAMSHEEREQRLLQSAKDNLRNFSFFGITEYLVESSILFEKTFGLKFGLKFDQKPISELNSAPMLNSLWNTASTYNSIATANHLDMELYKYASELFSNRLKAIGIVIDAKQITDEIKVLPANSSAFKRKKFRKLNYALDDR